MTSILFLSGREVDYIRNRVLLKALKSRYDTSTLRIEAPNTPLRMLSTLVTYLLRHPHSDLIFVGFYGQPLAIALSLVQNRPIVLDAYVSTFETLCEDRHSIRAGSFFGRLAAWLDRYSCRVATQILTDTKANADYFHRAFNVPREKLNAIYIGCDESVFYPRPEPQVASRTEVFYYGSFLPLQGIDVIIQAASHLKHHSDIHFTIGGHGMCFENVSQQINDLSLTNIDLIGWIPFDELPKYIARASICLGGHFSRIPKAARVISTKTFQFLAMKRPTIVGANAATAELFESGKHVLAIPMGDPSALASSILHLANDQRLRGRIAESGYALYQERLSTEKVADQLTNVVEKSLCRSRS